MEILGNTSLYGKEVCIHLDYSQTIFFFDGVPPEMNSLLCIHIPVEGRYNINVVSDYLQKINNAEGRKELLKIPQSMWRLANLDDFMKAENYLQYAYRVREYFKLKEILAFYKKWICKLIQDLEEANDKETLEALNILKANSRAAAILSQMFASLNSIVIRDIETLSFQYEFKILEKLRQSLFELDSSLKTVNDFKNYRIREQGLSYIAGHLSQDPYKQKIMEYLEKVKKYEELKSDTDNDTHIFWRKLKQCIKVEPNCSGKEIDITEANEVTVKLDWYLLEGDRIGNIAVGRTALLIEDVEKNTYIRATRRLKFKLQKSGGKKNFQNNTLTISTKKSNLGSLLLMADKLIHLSSIDPEKAVHYAKEQGATIPDYVWDISKRAKEDFYQSRVLADLLIELVTGIDSSVARQLAKIEAKSNRK